MADRRRSLFRPTRPPHRGLAVVGLLLASLGCSTVVTMSPLPRDSDLAERQRLEGSWLSEDNVIQIRFDSSGLGHFVGVSWQDEQFSLERGELVVSKSEELRLLSVRVEEDGKWLDGYYFARYRFTEHDDLLIWLPEAKVFAAAVEAGDLLGEVERGDHSLDVALTGPTERLLEFIDKAEGSALFDYEDPMVLKRVTPVTPPDETGTGPG